MKNIVLYDMDGTLTPPRQSLEESLIPILENLSEVSEGDYLNIEFEQSTVTTVETVKKLLKSNYNL